MRYILTEVVICLHVICIAEILDDGLHPMEHTHVLNNAAVSIGPRECALAHSQIFEANTLLISSKVGKLT